MKHNKYTKKIKLEVVQRRLNGDSDVLLAKEYGIKSRSSIATWIKQYKGGNIHFEETRGKYRGPNKGRKKSLNKMTDKEYIEHLKMEIEILKKTLEVEESIGSRKYINFEVAKKLSCAFKISALCRFLDISTSTYYRYVKNNSLKYDLKIMKIISNLHKKRISLGYRTIKRILKRKYNIICNHKKIIRIMQKLKIKGKQHRRRYIYFNNGKASRTYDNILNRNFNCTKSNQKWSIDITYIPEKDKNSYLVCIKDLYDRRIVSYENSTNMTEKFVQNTLKRAFVKNNIKNKNLILHSDQGIHFSTHNYSRLLDEYNVTGSHSRKGNCHDNAPIESFFSIFKREAFNFKKPNSFEETKIITKKFINYYNHDRVQGVLNEKTPNEYKFI